MSKGDLYFSKRIKEIRKEYELSQKQLADILGVGKTRFATMKQDFPHRICRFTKNFATNFTNQCHIL